MKHCVSSEPSANGVPSRRRGCGCWGVVADGYVADRLCCCEYFYRRYGHRRSAVHVFRNAYAALQPAVRYLAAKSLLTVSIRRRSKRSLDSIEQHIQFLRWDRLLVA